MSLWQRFAQETHEVSVHDILDVQVAVTARLENHGLALEMRRVRIFRGEPIRGVLISLLLLTRANVIPEDRSSISLGENLSCGKPKTFYLRFGRVDHGIRFAHRAGFPRPIGRVAQPKFTQVHPVVNADGIVLLTAPRKSGFARTARYENERRMATYRARHAARKYGAGKIHLLVGEVYRGLSLPTSRAGPNNRIRE